MIMIIESRQRIHPKVIDIYEGVGKYLSEILISRNSSKHLNSYQS